MEEIPKRIMKGYSSFKTLTYHKSIIKETRTQAD